MVATMAAAVLALAAVWVWREAGAALVDRIDASAHLLLWGGWSLIGLLIVWRGKPSRGNVALALAMSLIGLSRGLSHLETAWPAVAAPPFRLGLDIVTALAAAAYLRAAQLFPNPLARDDIDRPEAPWPRAGWLRAGLKRQLAPWLVWAVWGPAVAIAILAAPDAAAGPIAAPVILLGVAYWHVRYRVGDALERRQVTWFLLCAVLFALFAVLRPGIAALLATSGSAPLQPIGLAAFDLIRTALILACVVLAIFRAGAVNPDLIVRRTVVYGAAVALLVSAFNLIQSILVDSAVDALGVDDRFVSALLGTLAGLAFEPLTERLKAFLDRYAPQEGAAAGAAPPIGAITPP